MNLSYRNLPLIFIDTLYEYKKNLPFIEMRLDWSSQKRKLLRRIRRFTTM